MPPMEALAAAAATATPTIMPSDSAAGGGGHPGPWTFPVFVGCRRRLAPDDELFEAGNLEREALAREVGARPTCVSDQLLLAGGRHQMMGTAFAAHSLGAGRHETLTGCSMHALILLFFLVIPSQGFVAPRPLISARS